LTCSLCGRVARDHMDEGNFYLGPEVYYA
jgi:hypothetical protein